MNFTIHVGNGKVKHSGSASYSLSKTSGVLTVHTDDGKTLRYSPVWWQSADEAPA